MAPKHGLAYIKEEEQLAKRAKGSATPASRSATPADTNPVFSIVYPTMPALDEDIKRTQEEQDMIDAAKFQISPFDASGANKPGELDQYYVVTPTREWESMKKYNNFIIQGEVYTNNQFVFVRGVDTPKNKDTEGQPKDFWVARILQVRAKNAQHVYALVTWMYWPEELPPPAIRSPDQLHKDGGKRKYHGSHELVASNYMDVLDVLSFAGKAEVSQWLEEDDNLQYKLFWRQTYCRETQLLSRLRPHCVCNGYFNPEVTMYICDSPVCRVWLHDECLIDNILSKTYKQLVEDADSNGVAKPNGRKSKAGKKYKNTFRAKIVQNGQNPPEVHLTDLRAKAPRKNWTEPILCPKCSETLLS